MPEGAAVSRRVPRKASAGVSSVTEALAPRRSKKSKVHSNSQGLFRSFFQT